ncbi:hypothetical protein EUGRSUZ_D01512 [Eucalyptus grandis]|uniref:Uncharacterized protein n=2 Tax=Eucalyptus grandis TaxID=71139 RepID=A0ACC3L5P3_EUCGR|nr:hypothetical protein EUGRSUZ_D01512 [Eucalyptus grandis]
MTITRRIELFVESVAFLLLFLTASSSLRRRHNNLMLKVVLWVVYALPDHLITYTFGLMRESAFRNPLFLLWATFLMIFLGSLYSFSAYSLEDNEQWKKYAWQNMMWACQGPLLSSRGWDEYCKLKDICLSFSLVKLLSQRFCSYSLPKEAHKKLWKLIQNGLVAEENGYKRAFRVIELELSFLFDSFYTKYPIIFQSWQGNKRIEKTIGLICRTQLLKPWERKLRQYSLLESHGYSPQRWICIPARAGYIHRVREGKKQSSPAKLSSEYVFDQTILQSRDLLEGCKTGEERILKLKGIGMAVDDTSSVTNLGARLGQQLLKETADLTFIWKVLADFWAEPMVYEAPSDYVKAHVENLAMGGEFVTHFLALVSHANIKREPPVGQPTLKRCQS